MTVGVNAQRAASRQLGNAMTTVTVTEIVTSTYNVDQRINTCAQKSFYLGS